MVEGVCTAFSPYDNGSYKLYFAFLKNIKIQVKFSLTFESCKSNE